MKISRFVIPFTREGAYYIYNLKTLSLLSVDEMMYRWILHAIEFGVDADSINDKMESYLAIKRIIDDDRESDDCDFCYKMEYAKRLKSLTNRTLSLVIAPTLSCNFACPYCYEASLPSSLMKANVEDELIDFINSFTQTCDNLEICWSGGEPLIGFDNIESLYYKIQNKSKLPLIRQSIVTNGYLLTDRVCDFFRLGHVSLVQITIDGNEETHNKSRILKTGGKTYDAILSNIDCMVRMVPECTVVVRTNIHEGNKDEFGFLYKRLKSRWKDFKNVLLSPAFVQPNSNCKVNCCDSKDKTSFFLNLAHDAGISDIDFLPKHKLGSCSASVENSFIVAPNGDLFKCWNDIGINNRKVGSLSKGITNNALIAQYMVGSDKYHDMKCMRCCLFPICDGGCNRRRIDNKLEKTSYDLCPFTKKGVEDCIYEYIKTRKHA